MPTNKHFERKMNICGEDTVALIITNGSEELVRFLVTGSWCGPQDLSKVTDEMMVKTYSDGSFNITVTKLIPAHLCNNEDALASEMDRVLNGIEDALGLDLESLSSSSFHAGHEDTQWDYLLPEKDKTVLRLAGIGATGA